MFPSDGWSLLHCYIIKWVHLLFCFQFYLVGLRRIFGKGTRGTVYSYPDGSSQKDVDQSYRIKLFGKFHFFAGEAFSFQGHRLFAQ